MQPSSAHLVDHLYVSMAGEAFISSSRQTSFQVICDVRGRGDWHRTEPPEQRRPGSQMKVSSKTSEADAPANRASSGPNVTPSLERLKVNAGGGVLALPSTYSAIRYQLLPATENFFTSLA